MKLKINVEKYLGIKKDFSVNENAGNSKRVYRMQAKIAEIFSLEDKVKKMRIEKDFPGIGETYEDLADSIVQCENFLCEVLKLTKKQASKLDLLEETNLFSCTQSVITQYQQEQIKIIESDDEKDESED